MRACYTSELSADSLLGIVKLWDKRWDEIHHPALAYAYAVNPEYHRSQPWSDASVKKDIDTVFKKFFPDVDERGGMKAVLQDYQNQRRAFATHDSNADKREEWTDSFMTSTSPWDWWDNAANPEFLVGPFKEEKDAAYAKNLKKFKELNQRILKIAVASSCNERVFSSWHHILGNRRTKTGKKRQLDAVSVYSNERVIKKIREVHHAAYDSSSESSDDDE